MRRALAGDLFLLPFDHRGSFQNGFPGIGAAEITALKQVTYDGFRRALSRGVPRERAGVLLDEQYGAAILATARAEGILTACAVEKSGQMEFDFEYGENFGDHLRQTRPVYAKALVRYNPAGDSALNARQATKLRRLSRFCTQEGFRLLLEVLVPATVHQLAECQGDRTRFDQEQRPALMVQAMASLQDAGIEPVLWKVEGLDSEVAANRVAAQAQAQGRSGSGVLVLGRGEDVSRVRCWLRVAATVPGIRGFAVGRTVFWEPLQAMRRGELTAGPAANRIARNFQALCDLWSSVRQGLDPKRSEADSGRGAGLILRNY